MASQISLMLEAVRAHPRCKLFLIGDSERDDFRQWTVKPFPSAQTVPEEEGFWLVEAIPSETQECAGIYYLDLVLPERINDYTYLVSGDEVRQVYTHELGIEVVPALACETFGVYELYYSKKNPKVGLDVLRAGLKTAKRKASVAQDLGYICRDEGLVYEAIEAFSVAIEEGASSSFILRERADLLEKAGDVDGAQRDRKVAEDWDRRDRARYGRKQ